MEEHFSVMGKGLGYWASQLAQMEESTSFDGGMKISASEDMFNNFSELINFDSYAGWCNSPSMIDQCLANGFSSFSSLQYPLTDGLNLMEQNNSPFFITELGGNYNDMEIQQMDTQLGFSDDDENNLDSKQKLNGPFQLLNPLDIGDYIISGSSGKSLDERMLRALSFFKESADGGILAQVWVPIKNGDEFILSTSEQPFLLDQKLAGYREVSRAFTFSAEGKPGSCHGLPSRVFISQAPEWTSNVGYYNKTEYARLEHAINHEVRGSIALPVLDLHSQEPCAVLELVTTKEKPNFDREFEIVSHALQLVNLRTTMPPRLHPQYLSKNKRAALTEIVDVLRAVCHAHRLPLALTWIPCYYSEGIGDETERIRIKEGHASPNEKCVLCIEESACYINDRAIGGFVHACLEHHLEEGQGIAGKALQSNHPFFYSDVKTYNVSEYRLVHHARKYNLNAAVAIRLRSTYTNDDDYILEFFLPANMTGSSEQQLLLDNLSGTMQRICRSLRTVSDAELTGIEVSQFGFPKEKVQGFFPVSRRNSQVVSINDDHGSIQNISLKASNHGTNEDRQAMSGSRKPVEKKRSTVEKNVSLKVLQQYFSGSLKDAAKSIGVCPTTLKRICRQHGILRWPSRKINKVNRSLKKIQTVLESVQGVEGGLKFDPYTGGFVAGGTIIHEINPPKTLLFHDKISTQDSEPIIQEAKVSLPPRRVENSAIKLENNNACLVRISNSCEGIVKKDNASSFNNCPKKMISDEVEAGMDEHNNPTSSSMTDSSNGSGSTIRGSSAGSHSQSFENQKHSKTKSTSVDSGSKFIVKASYRGDTIRFKFDPSNGCSQLYEEVATRFKLQNGSFQLKYLDDEEEWVMLVNDSDLQECTEILDDIGTRCVKFLIRDMPCALSSRGSNSCFLSDSS